MKKKIPNSTYCGGMCIEIELRMYHIEMNFIVRKYYFIGELNEEILAVHTVEVLYKAILCACKHVKI